MIGGESENHVIFDRDNKNAIASNSIEKKKHIKNTSDEFIHLISYLKNN